MRIAMIGCGNMGKAMASHFAKVHDVVICTRHPEKAKALAKTLKVKSAVTIAEAIKGAEVVVLAMKPKDLSAVKMNLSKNQLLISILAGVSNAVLRKQFPKVQIVRIMPNLPLVCGKGVIGLVEDKTLSEKNKAIVESLLKGMGILPWLTEAKIDAIAALAGSGPALLYVIIEAMIESGVYMGFTAAESKEFTLQTIEGAVELLRYTKKAPSELRLEIASPGGMTIAGMKAMEDRSVRAGIKNGFITAFEKGKTLH